MEKKIHPKFNVHENYTKMNIVNPYRYGSGGGAPVGGVDVDYQAVLDFASNNAIPLPSSAQQDIDNQLMIDYKTTGGWVKDDCFFKFKGTADSAFKLIDWKRLIKAVAYGGLTWSVDGVIGNGTNAYIDTLFSPLNNGINYTQNNAGICFGMVTTPSELTVLIGARDVNSNGINIIPNRPTSSTYFNINSNLGVAEFPAAAGIIGFNGLYRINSESCELYIPGNATKNDPSTSALLVSENIYILARNLTGTADLFATNTLNYATVGASKSSEHASIENILT